MINIKSLMKLALAGLILSSLVSALVFIEGQEPDNGNLEIEESYEAYLNHETTVYNNEPLEFEYQFNIDIESGNVPLYEALNTLEVNKDYPLDDIDPYPSSISGNLLSWDVGFIPLDEEWRMEWKIEEKTQVITPGFTAERSMDSVTLPSGQSEFIQTTYVTVTPGSVPNLDVTVEYSQDQIVVECLSAVGPGEIEIKEDMAEFRLESPASQEYQFEATFRVIRDTSYEGALTVYPWLKVASWASTQYDHEGDIQVPVEIGVVDVSTNPPFLWDTKMTSKTIVKFRGLVEFDYGHMGTLEYHIYESPSDQTYVSADPRDLYYSLHYRLQSHVGALQDIDVDFYNIHDWTSLEYVEPTPDVVSSDSLSWSLGYLYEGDGEDINWVDPERVHHESLGFEVTRTIDNIAIPVGVDSITQTTTFDITHYETDKYLHAGVAYQDDFIDYELIDCSLPEYADTNDNQFEWTLPPGHDSAQNLWVTYMVTRKPGVIGEIVVYPGSRTDSRTKTWIDSDTAHLTTEFGEVMVSTSNDVFWELKEEHSKTVFWNEEIKPLANTASVVFLQNRGTGVEGFSLPNDPVALYFNNGINVNNEGDYDEYPINDLRITLDSDRYFDHWNVWGDRPQPDEFLVDPNTDWNYNWWLWHQVPDDGSVEIGVRLSDMPYIVEAPGFASSRSVSPMTFTEPTVQHVVVTVDIAETKPDEDILVRVLTVKPVGMEGNPYFDAEIIEGSWNLEPFSYSQEIVEWNVPEVAGQHVVEVDIQLTPHEPGYEYTFVPLINVHDGIGEEEVLESPVLTSELFLDDVVLHPDAGVIGDITIGTADEVLWTHVTKYYMRTIDFKLIAEASVIDHEPPTVDILSPLDGESIRFGSDRVYEFAAEDNIDPDLDVVGYLSSLNGYSGTCYSGQPILLENGSYSLTVEATDDAGNTASESVVFTVYDPDVGFITGGGWIGAKSDKTHFTANIKYRDGAPEGHFNLKDKDGFEFKSGSFSWMAVNGDTGLVEGSYTDDAGLYTYILEVVDGDGDSEKPDYLTVTVWSGSEAEGDPVYTLSGELDGGNIQIHDRIMYINIGVTTNDMLATNALTGIASQDINSYCVDNEVPYRFIYHVLDNEGSSAKVLENTQTLHDLGINLVIGHPWSSQCSASLDYINENDMLLFSGSSTSPLLALPDNLYRMCTNDLVQARVIARLYQELGIKAVVVYHNDHEVWGHWLSDALVAECAVAGVEVLESIPYDTAEWDPGQDLQHIEDLILGSGYQLDEIAFETVSTWEIVQILQEAEGFPTLLDVTWVGWDGTSRVQGVLDEALYPASEVKLYSPSIALDPDAPGFMKFSDMYEALTGEEPIFYTAASYDIYRVLAMAVINVGGMETEAIKAEIMRLVDGYPGVSGTCTLDENGDRIGADYDLWGYGWHEGEPYYPRIGCYDLETDSVTLYPVENSGVVSVLVEDWWAVVKDRSYEATLHDVIMPMGDVYSNHEQYAVYVDWTYLCSDEVAVVDTLKPGLALEPSVVEANGCGDVSYSYDPETGVIQLYVSVSDRVQGNVNFRCYTAEPLPEPALFVDSPSSSQIVVDGSGGFTHTLCPGQLAAADKLSYYIAWMRFISADPSYPSLVSGSPEPTQVFEGDPRSLEAIWWYLVDPSTRPGSYPIDMCEEDKAVSVQLGESQPLENFDSLFIRYIGDGDDVPTQLRDPGAVPDVVLSDTGDRVRGWESMNTWPWQSLEGLVRSAYTVTLYQLQ